MPDKRTTEKAKEDLREGKSASTAAGEFVHREIDKIREGEHGAKNTKQAIAIGLSEARKAGVPIRDNPNRPAKKRSSPRRRKSSESSAKRSRATMKALKRMPRSTVSRSALSRQAKGAASKRSAASRSAAAKKAARTRAARAR